MDENKFKKWKKKGDELFADMAEDLFDAEVIKTAEDTLRDIFKSENIPYQRSTAKAFLEGLRLITTAKDTHVALSLPIIYSLVTQRMEKKISNAVDKALENPKTE